MIKKTVCKDIFGKRLSQLMEEHNETTYSMAERFSLSSPTISRYMTGQMAAKVTTIQLMADYFHVNPIWLMGFDVPKYEKIESTSEQNSHSEPIIMSYYNQLNALGQETATEHVRLLTLDKKYTEKSVREYPSLVRDSDADYLTVDAAHARTDIQIPDDDDDPYDDKIMDDENF